MTKLPKEEHEALMADMQAFDEQMPRVGIFWYAPAGKVLFGVGKSELMPKTVEEFADKGLPFINHPALRHQVWVIIIQIRFKTIFILSI